jgi:DNA-binding response OmpR family regulator
MKFSRRQKRLLRGFHLHAGKACSFEQATTFFPREVREQPNLKRSVMHTIRELREKLEKEKCFLMRISSCGRGHKVVFFVPDNIVDFK